MEIELKGSKRLYAAFDAEVADHYAAGEYEDEDEGGWRRPSLQARACEHSGLVSGNPRYADSVPHHYHAGFLEDYYDPQEEVALRWIVEGIPRGARGSIRVSGVRLGWEQGPSLYKWARGGLVELLHEKGGHTRTAAEIELKYVEDAKADIENDDSTFEATNAVLFRKR